MVAAGYSGKRAVPGLTWVKSTAWIGVKWVCVPSLILKRGEVLVYQDKVGTRHLGLEMPWHMARQVNVEPLAQIRCGGHVSHETISARDGNIPNEYLRS